LPVQVKEGLVVAVAMEDLAAPPPPIVVAVAGQEWMVTETATPQARSELQIRTGPDDEDVVMAPADQGTPLPLLAKEHEVAPPEAPEAPEVVTVPPSGGEDDVPTSGYWSIPGIGIIDLDSTELPSNDREIFKAVVD
jgi:hypothetical protein